MAFEAIGYFPRPNALINLAPNRLNCCSGVRMLASPPTPERLFNRSLERLDELSICALDNFGAVAFIEGTFGELLPKIDIIISYQSSGLNPATFSTRTLLATARDFIILSISGSA